jgi:hypothetical protein
MLYQPPYEISDVESAMPKPPLVQRQILLNPLRTHEEAFGFARTSIASIFLVIVMLDAGFQ